MRLTIKLARPAVGRLQRLRAAHIVCCLVATLASWVCGGAAVADQSISLRSGWNLIALNVEPVDRNVAVILAPLMHSGQLRSIWSYDTAADSWAVFPAIPGEQALSELEPGLGYWIRVEGIAQPISLAIEGRDDVIPRGAAVLVPGWNLIGFIATDKLRYDRALHGLAVRQIWTFDAVSRSFKGVVLREDERGNPIAPNPEEFTEIDQGRGYWVLSGEDASLEPELGTALSPDIDAPPLLQESPPGVRQVFSPVTPGDRDLGGDGFFDRAEDQRAVDFGDFSSEQRISIFNRASGVLTWRARIEDPSAVPWLRFHVTGETPAQDQYLDELSGTVATETAEINLFTDRRGLSPGVYSATVTLDSNGRPGSHPAEPLRSIKVSMEVAPLDGDYDVLAKIETIDGNPADTHNPRLFLTLYRDQSGLKGIIDGSRTLLIPEYCVGGPLGTNRKKACSQDAECGAGGRCEHHVRLAGRNYENHTNRFIVSGSFELLDGADDNPYRTALRRDITLIGDRPGRTESSLGPQDLQGEYYETVRGVLGQPIAIRGTFTASRVDPVPRARDIQTSRKTLAQDVPDGATTLLSQTLDVSEKLLLSEVDVSVNLAHDRPEQLVVILRSPSGTEVVLRNRTGGQVGELTYDQSVEPAESLEKFIGQRSSGTWTLTVEDQVPGVIGSVLEWSLNLRGTRVADISGRVTTALPGATVVLTGCGRTLVAVTDGNRRYRFTDLIDCPYAVTVHASGYQSLSRPIALQGADLLSEDLGPLSAPPDPTIEMRQPESDRCAVGGQLISCTLIARTTSGSAGVLHLGGGSSGYLQQGKLQYAIDSATFDIDREPGGLTTPRDEDSNAFLATSNPVTGTNVRGINGSLDGPPNIGRARRAFVVIGLPVIGQTVSGDLHLGVGANP